MAEAFSYRVKFTDIRVKPPKEETERQKAVETRQCHRDDCDMAGDHPADPISVAAPTEPFLHTVDNPTPPKRVAYSADLNGLTPVDAESRSAITNR